MKRLTPLSLWMALALLGAVTAFSYRATNIEAADRQWVAHTHEVLETLDELRTSTVAMQSARRGFVLTGDDAQVRSFDRAAAARHDAEQHLRILTVDNASQQRRLDSLAPRIARSALVLETGMSERRRHGFDLQRDAADTRAGAAADDELAPLFDAMENEERRLLDERMRRVTQSGLTSYALRAAASALSVALVVLAYLALRREHRHRRESDPHEDLHVGVRKNGSEVPLEISLGPVVTDDGVLGSSAIRDITERVRAEESLRLSEERFRLLADSVKDYAIFMLDPDGLVTSWNKGAERIKGYSADEIIGQHFSRFYPADAKDKPQLELTLATKDGQVVDEGWRIRKDGTRFWATVVISAVRGPKGTLLGFAKVTRDLTERRRVDEALKLANRDLEAFSYSVAHDLRAPLRAMNGFAQILLDTNRERLDDEGRDCVDEILASASRMGSLIEALLSLAHVGRSRLTVERVDLASLARAAAAQLVAAEPTRSVELIIPDELWVAGDAPLLRALLQNLLGNAWKFTGKVEHPRVELGVGKDTEGSDTYFIRDNGAGFDMAYSKRLFGAFQRLHAQSEFAGTGIGLASVHRIVQRHGGRIWAEGAVGDGATFRFTLADRHRPPMEAA